MIGLNKEFRTSVLQVSFSNAWRDFCHSKALEDLSFFSTSNDLQVKFKDFSPSIC